LAQEFEEIFRKHYQLVYRTAWRVTGTPEDAEDVSQTIFLRLLRREFPPDLTKNPKSYLYRAAVNLSLDTIRLRQRETLLGGESKRIGAQQDSASASSDEELHRQLYEAIAELNPGAAHILLLRYVHSYSDAEIAKLLGTSRGTIAVSLFRSRARLKKLIRASLGEK
jgi:RNA polymerase sigma-70 factor (ECF subfamily)